MNVGSPVIWTTEAINADTDSCSSAEAMVASSTSTMECVAR